MNVLLVSAFFAPNIVGGTEALNLNLAVAAKLNNINISILSFDTLSTKTEEINNIPIKRVYIPGLSEELLKIAQIRTSIPKLKLLYYLFAPQFRSRFKTALNQSLTTEPAYDLVHFSSNFAQFPIDILLNLIKNRYSNSRIIISFHDHILLGRATNFPHKSLPIISQFKRKALKKYGDLFAAPSSYILNLVREDLKLPESKTFLLYNSIPPNMQMKETPNLFDDNPIILYAGGFEYGKGVDILCAAFVELLKDYPSVKLMLLGDGVELPAYLEILSEAPPDSYSVSGKVPQEKLYELFNKANFVILPSRYNEIFGMILAEGYYSGALPLGSNKGAIPEVLSNDDDLLFLSKDELKERLSRFLNDPELIKNKRNALKRGMEQFSSSYFVSSLIKLYNQN